jgi:hypothetical protein
MFSVTNVLPPKARARLEEFFEADLGDVRLCTSRLARVVAGVCRADGVTLGRFVFLSRRGERRDLPFLAHEVAHVLQYRQRGIPRFLLEYVAGWIAGGFRYSKISLEREAFERERRFIAPSRRPTSP